MDVDAFSFKEGPTESGAVPALKLKALLMEPSPVGGEILPFNILGALPKYWLLGFALLIPLLLLFYRKKELVFSLLSRIV